MAEKTESRSRVLLKLFTGMLGISTFTFGGGFVIVSLMKQKFVDQLHWIDENEMMDLTALAQTAPGPIAVNAAVLVGRRMGGFAGMLAAVLGTVLPPMAVLLALSACYEAFAENRYAALMLKGMQAGVAAVIFGVVWDLGRKAADSPLHIVLMAAAFVAAFVFKVNVVLLLALAVLISILAVLLQQRGQKNAG